MHQAHLRFFTCSPLFKRLHILSMIEQNPAISQNRLAGEVGMTASMVNNYIKELAREKLIRIRGKTNRTMSYNLTLRGDREKMSLLVAYNLETTALYMDAKQEFARRLKRIGEEGIRQVVLFGAGETAEILYNAAKPVGLRIIGVVDNDPGKQGTLFGNLIIKSPEAIEVLRPDGVIIASVGRQDEIYSQICFLERRGIAVRKIGSFFNGAGEK